MHVKSGGKHVACFVLSALLGACQTSNNANPTITSTNPAITNANPAIARDDVANKFELHLPKQTNGKFPAVILIHGSAGPDSRYDWYRPAMLKAGIGVAQVDFHSELFRENGSRRSYEYFMPYVFGILNRLRSNPRVDNDRIGIVGFSWGGMISLMSASAFKVDGISAHDQRGIAAHVALYPPCWYINRIANRNSGLKFTNNPMLMLYGDQDTKGRGLTQRGTPPKSCPATIKLINKGNPGQVEHKVYKGAHHAFDRLDPKYLRKGDTIFAFHDGAARDARRRVLSFLRSAFAK